MKACHGQTEWCIKGTSLPEMFPFRAFQLPAPFCGRDIVGTVITIIPAIVEKQTEIKGVEKLICQAMKLDEKVVQQVKWNPYSHNFKLLTCMLYLKKRIVLVSLDTYIYIDRSPSHIAVKVILILFVVLWHYFLIFLCSTVCINSVYIVKVQNTRRSNETGSS